MALAFTVTDHWSDGKRLHVVGTIVASGNYATGGDTLNLANSLIKSNKNPVHVVIQGQAGYKYEYVAGATLSAAKVIARQSAGSAAPMAELAAAGYPGGVSGDTIRFYGIFRKLI